MKKKKNNIILLAVELFQQISIWDINFFLFKISVTKNLSTHAQTTTHVMPYVNDCKPNNNVKHWL